MIYFIWIFITFTISLLPLEALANPVPIIGHPHEWIPFIVAILIESCVAVYFIEKIIEKKYFFIPILFMNIISVTCFIVFIMFVGVFLERIDFTITSWYPLALSVLLGEVIIVLVEGVLIYKLIEYYKKIKIFKKSILISLAANLASIISYPLFMSAYYKLNELLF